MHPGNKGSYVEIMANWDRPHSKDARLVSRKKAPMMVEDKENVAGRIKQMQACLVARIEGEVSFIQTLAVKGKKVWRVTREIQVKQLPRVCLCSFVHRLQKREG